MARVIRIYEGIGVSTKWVVGQGSARTYHDGQLHLTVLLLSREMTERQTTAREIGDNVLGQAHMASGRASIFCDRIAVTPGASKILAIPLGAVIAHEVGHLLLPVNGHSWGGIMSADMDMHTTALQSFNAMETRAIRTMLAQ